MAARQRCNGELESTVQLIADKSSGEIGEIKRARCGRRVHRALDPDWQLGGGGVLPIYEGALGGGGALPSRD